MTPQTSLELAFGDGDYLFDLRLPQLAELQEKRGIGVMAIYARVLRGRYLFEGETIGVTNEAEGFAEDFFDTIRLGLIGGGRGIVDGREVAVSAGTARTLVERYCHTAPLRDSWAVAAAILGARVEGYTPPKKAAPADKPAARKRKSTSRASSPTAQSSEQTGEP